MIRSIILDRKLETNGLIANGKIIDYKLGYRGTIAFIYSFEVNGKRILSKTSFPELIPNQPTDFIDKSFPVIYLSDNVSYCELLISRYSFDKFNIPFPDTLKWVTEFEKK